jgi:hypothetical protein
MKIMSKRLIEFNCGDPKSNQQTASKVECQVTIHNHGDKHVGTVKAPKQTRTIKARPLLRDNIKLNEEVEVFDSTAYVEKQHRSSVRVIPSQDTKPTDIELAVDEEDASETSFEQQPPPSRITRSADILTGTRIITPVRKLARNVPATNEQFVVVASQPTVSAIEIAENIEFHKKRADILTHILCEDNFKLMANLIDASGKVIISQQDFCELVALMLSTDEHHFEPSQIKLVLREEIVSNCLKVQVSPFKAIVEIKIDNHDFNVVHNEAANVLKNVYNISTDMVYAGVFGIKA